jgi:hypothetical protein
MPIADPNKIWPKLEKLGPEEVRRKSAIGVYANYKIPVIEEWLRRKEEETTAPAIIPHQTKKTEDKIYSPSRQQPPSLSE